jgi:hypothetical protein
MPDIIAQGMAATANAAAALAGSANSQSNLVLRGSTLGKGNSIAVSQLPAFPVSAPVVTFGTTAMSGATSIYGVSSAGVLNTANFRYTGSPLASWPTAPMPTRNTM